MWFRHGYETNSKNYTIVDEREHECVFFSLSLSRSCSILSISPQMGDDDRMKLESPIE